MKPQYEQQLAELAKELVTPERFGKVAVLTLVEPLPEALPFYAVPYEQPETD